MASEFFVRALLVFFSAMVVDILYARWAFYLAKGKPVPAAAASIGIGAAGLVGLTGVVGDHWLAVPYLVGLGVGTLVGAGR